MTITHHLNMYDATKLTITDEFRLKSMIQL